MCKDRRRLCGDCRRADRYLSGRITVGWQLIGRTPLKLYDAEREEPVLLKAGQYIRFRSVTENEYREIEKQVQNDTYRYVVHDREA